LSHLKERKHRNCLNCNAQVHGKYCHICGQENIEPEETAWHLVTHFFNDITHFDGKFFSTLKLLVFKPGFLSAEYKMGRRAAYLNPVRMYIFTSFIFFLVFFSLYSVKDALEDKDNRSVLETILRQDSSSLSIVKNETVAMDSFAFSLYSRAINKGNLISKEEFFRKIDSAKKSPKQRHEIPVLKIDNQDSIERESMNRFLSQMDSATFSSFTKTINDGENMSREDFKRLIDSTRQSSGISFKRNYSTRQEYDSLVRNGAVKDSWLERTLTKKFFEIDEKYTNNKDKLITNLFNIFLHNFPQMLFISLPLFALFLKLIYYRHKDYYFVSHGIYSIHLYIFYFIALLIIISIEKINSYFEWQWFSVAATGIFFLLLFYEYKAMRNYYRQGRGKTVIKFLLATSWRLFVIIFLSVIFLFLSLLKV
jgi:hypothetical protein